MLKLYLQQNFFILTCFCVSLNYILPLNKMFVDIDVSLFIMLLSWLTFFHLSYNNSGYFIQTESYF